MRLVGRDPFGIELRTVSMGGEKREVDHMHSITAPSSQRLRTRCTTLSLAVGLVIGLGAAGVAIPSVPSGAATRDRTVVMIKNVSSLGRVLVDRGGHVLYV